MEKNSDKKRIAIAAIALGQLVLVIAVTIYGAFTGNFIGRKSDYLMAASLVVYWILMDIVEPVVMKRFVDITPERQSAYLKFLVCDFAGLAGLAYFLFHLSGSSSSGIWGAVVYVLAIRLKRESQDIFYGRKVEETDKADADEADVELLSDTVSDDETTEADEESK